jgi:uncharacterized damage-inducible protein DinB
MTMAAAITVSVQHTRHLQTRGQGELASVSEDFHAAARLARSMPVGELLQHAANHGVHHRGQVSLLRLLGYNPDNFDILFYYIEKHHPRAS